MRLIKMELFSAVPLVIVFIWYLYQRHFLEIQLLLQWLTRYLIVFMLFLTLYAGLALAMLSTLPLYFTEVFCGGLGCGDLLSALGSFIPFFVAKHGVGGVLEKYFDNTLVDRIQRDLTFNSLQCVAFLQVNPAIPTGPLNYLLGHACVDLRAYFFSTAVFFISPVLLSPGSDLKPPLLLCEAY